MKNSFTQIAAAFFPAIFVTGWMGVYLPSFSFEFFKQSVTELTAKTESENPEKEKEEKASEKNLIHHRIDLQLHASDITGNKNLSLLHKSRWPLQTKDHCK